MFIHAFAPFTIRIFFLQYFRFCIIYPLFWKTLERSYGVEGLPGLAPFDAVVAEVSRLYSKDLEHCFLPIIFFHA